MFLDLIVAHGGDRIDGVLLTINDARLQRRVELAEGERDGGCAHCLELRDQDTGIHHAEALSLERRDVRKRLARGEAIATVRPDRNRSHADIVEGREHCLPERAGAQFGRLFAIDRIDEGHVED
jgi:hypothetical protein